MTKKIDYYIQGYGQLRKIRLNRAHNRIQRIKNKLRTQTLSPRGRNFEEIDPSKINKIEGEMDEKKIKDIAYLRSIGLIPVKYITKRHRMKEIGLDNKKWNWNPHNIESVCFQLVENQELKNFNEASSHE